MAEQDKPVRTDSDIQNSILTTSQRKFLQSNIQGTAKARNTRARIRKRVHQGMRDFRILSDCLEERDREKIFETENYPSSVKLQNDVKATIAFMYAGVGGESGFREPLIDGVQIGESRLRDSDTKFRVEPRFTVDFVSHTDRQKAVKTVKNGDWDKLSSRSLFDFIKFAHEVGAIDFDRLDSYSGYFEGIPGAEDTGE